MKLKTYLLIVISFLVNSIPIFNWFEVSFRLKFNKDNSKAKETVFVSPILKTFFVFITALVCLTSNAQNYKPFTIRYNKELKGNMLLIGNNILGKDNNALSDNSVNQSTNMQYIDIDSDATTFSSSSANLKMPATASCFKIAYAGLYWGAILQVPQSRTDINKIKLKLPGNTNYTDITGELIYDAIVAPIAAGTNEPTNTPYACYADVTTLVSALTNPQGTFTVANVTSSLGFNSSTGLSAGWTLFVVYEDTNATTKSITTFDGFSSIYDDKTLSIPISGFTTPPSGIIDIKYAFASLEGDKGEIGSKTEINGKAIVNAPQRASNKFFNSAITDTNGYFTDRIPNSSNTLGYDTGIESILGAEKSVISHGATSATITVQVAKGQADPIFSFFNAFAVDVIAPDIALTKTVEDASGNDASNANVTLGQNLYYEINYQNIGNDHVTNFTIKDILPENIIFNYPGDIDLRNSGGATVQSYNPLTRTIIFSIPNTSVEISDPQYTIRIKVQVVPTCNQLSNACSNEIKNQAFATYRGIVNTTQITDDASFSTTICNFGTAQPTNFLVGITNCTFQRTEVLCGASVVLSASDGYASYSWSTSPTGTPVIGTAQTYTATQTGVYYVRNTASGTCLSIDEEITVVPYGNTITNPVIPFADVVPICPNNGKVLPNIFLCGANATRWINTGISDAASIVWQKLDESSCAAVTIDNCANESSACTWNQVGTGPDYTANTAGQFRVTINYVGGCYSVFYFNVYQNVLNPTVTSQDIICNTLGEITVGGVPGGYEYSLNVAGPYQTSNVFSITSPNSYTVYIKQVGVVTNPCIFTVPDILIRERDFTVSKFVSQPLCNGDSGVIKLAANDARPQYYFSIHQGATLINSVGPIIASDYEFSGLNPGIYTARVWIDDGCEYSENIEIINPPLLTATSDLTKPLTCTDGEITVTPIGGTPPYTYYVNSTTDYQNTPQIAVTNPIPAGGIYTIIVEDSKGCSATTTITVAEILPPVYTISQTNILCYNDTTGEIKFNVTNANGYTLAYSIDNGVTYLANPTFSNLSAGTYNTIVKYTLAGTDCFSTAQTITITHPSTALTASAGVSELAGCGPSGEGKIRITNPQGGTAPYEYSFDNQATWTTVNDAYKAPGTYTVYIRDANGCIFAMPDIIIDPKPVEPTIEIDEAVFNCDGTATSTVTVTNNGGANYSYQYLLDGVPNANVPSNVFTNVPSGTHTVSVMYSVNSVSTYSNLLQEDFGKGGFTTTPGINPAYCFEDEATTHLQASYKCNKDEWINDGEYAVASAIRTTFGGVWIVAKDHTVPSDPLGRFLCVNVGGSAGIGGILYSKPIYDVIPNQPVMISLWAENLIKAVNSGHANPKLTIQLVNNLNGVGGTETIVATTDTTNPWVVPKSEKWEYKELSLNPGAYNNLSFVIRSYSNEFYGNDVLIDDIWVRQMPKSCITQKDFPILIDSNKAFNASITGFKNVSCFDANDGEITIAAQNFDATKGFQYSIDNGVNWFTQMTSPHTITGLANGTYDVKVRYDVTSTGSCVQSFTQILTAPATLITTATVTSLATCTVGATITASSTGGTTAYRYELWDATGTTNVQPSQNTGIFTNVASGTYIVRGYDANNCTDDTVVLTVVTPPIVTATLDPSSDLCFDSVNQASLIVNASGGTSPYVYSLDGAPSQNSNTFSNVGVGTHTIVVTDSFGCAAVISNITIAPQLTVAITNIKTLDCTASPNAVITGTITGGNAPFVVTILSGTGPGTITQPTATTFTYTTSVESTYQFQIQDAQGCSTTVTASINPLVAVTATLDSVNPSCNGASDGSVQITPSGGVGPYTYSSDGIAYVSSSLFSGLGDGNYTFYIKDSKECFITQTVTLTQPIALATSATATAFSCSATNTKQSATITIAVPSTGTAPYQYSFNGGGYTNANTLTLNDDGTDQIISYSVKDAKGCTHGSTITLLKLNPPTALSFSPAAPITCTETTTTITATATNGVGTLTYAITFPLAAETSNTTGVFAGLSPDTYIFKVTDANGCYYSESYVVNPVTPITVIATKLTNVDCFGNTTGSIRYNVSGFATYSYSVNGGTAITGQTAAVFTLPNLGAATYDVVFTDETAGCTAPTSITITQPAATLSATIAQVNANCFTPTSQVTVTPDGGTASYTYAYKQDGVAPIATDYVASNIANLNPATNANWDVWIKDANGCTIQLDVVITTDPVLVVTAYATGQCLGMGSYTMTAAGSGGMGTLNYSINNGGSYQAGNTFVVTTAGSYTIRVKDGNGCTADSAPVVVASQLTLSAVLNKGITCNPAPTAAQITINATGGTAPFSYESKEASGAYTAMASNVFNSSVAGNYTFRATDTNGCTAVTTTAIVVTTPINPEITSVTQTQTINCNGEATAAISIVIDNTKGQSPFVFNIYNNTLGIDYGTHTSGLRAGNYTITVTDTKGCTDTFPYVINEPQPIDFDLTKVDITCDAVLGTSLGSISVENVSGGTAPFKYFITNNFGDLIAGNPYGATTSENHTFPIINYGLYTLNVVDANGCSLSKQITMASPPSDLTIDVTTSVSDCINGGTAIVKAISTVGSNNYAFGILETNVAPYTSTYFTPDVGFPDTKTFTNLTPGVVYTFVVHDLTTGCYFIKSADQPIAPASTLVSTVRPMNVTCKGENDGSVTFTISNFDATTTSVDYQIYKAFSNTTIGASANLPVVFGTTYTVTAPLPGTLPPGRYYVQFIENGTGSFSGCKSASTAFDISESSIDLSVSATKIKNVNCNEDGVIAAQAKDGTAPYTYQYLLASNPAPTAATLGWTANTTFATSVTGNYIVYVKDAYGCIKQDAVTLDADDAPTITSPIVPICYDGSTPFTITILGTVDPDIVGGATYSVNGSAFQTSPSFTFNAAGTYNLVIKDGNGCTVDVNYEVYPKLNLTASLTKELDCTASPAATITLTTTGGDTTPAANYTYEVSFNIGAFAAASNPYTATTAGNYVFRVTDANNPTLCQATTTFTLDPIQPTLFTTTQTNVSCNAGTDGTITVNVTSGFGPYEYQLDAGTFQTSNVFTGLAAGTTYVITVRDAKSCLYPSAPITITEPVVLTATSAITTPLTCGAANAAQPASVTVNGINGTAPYVYSFDGGTNYSATNTYQSYIGITFDVFVKDTKGCLYTLPNGVNIPALVPPTNLDFVSTTVTCLALTSDVTLTATNGVGTLSYEILSPASATSNVTGASSGIFTGLLPNTYLFQVTDANFCTYQESFIVNPVTNITVSGQLINDVTCNPGSTGVAKFTVANFTGTYSFVLIAGTGVITQTGNVLDITNLGVDTYTMRITDNITGCTADATVVVNQPAVLDLTELSNVPANCNFGAKVSVNATGGTPNYVYAFVQNGLIPAASDYTSSASAVLDPTVNSQWDVYVKDVNGCTDQIDVTIVTDPFPSVTVNSYSQCPSATGEYNFTVAATGMAPFEYSIGAGFQTSPTFTVNAAGTYNVTVKDKNGCTTTVSGLVSILQALQLQAAITALPSCIDGDGTLTLLATGGSGNYEYSIDSGAFQASANFTNIFSGTHTVTVRDVITNCSNSIPVTFSAATPITGFVLSKTDVTCNGGSDGTITATLSPPAVGVNDNPIYTYSIDGGTTTQTSSIFSGLIAGTYTIAVTSGRGCVATQIMTVNEPNLITIPAPTVAQFGCNSGSNAMNFTTITVSGVTGGSGIYTNYEFLKGGTRVQFGANNVYTEANLLGGTYTVNVYDDKGCIGTTTTPIVINPYIAIDKINIAINNAITCTNLEDITVSVSSIGGTPTNLQYTVTDSNMTTGVIGANYNFTNTTGVFTGLNIGNYLITVDNLDTGCSIQDVHYINNPNTFDLTIGNIVDVTCFGGTNGSANVTIIDRTITATNPDQAGAFSYTIVDALGNTVTSGTSASAGSLAISALAAGIYTITATLTNSPFCTVNKNFTITQPAAALAIAETHTAITCISGNNDGSISATATGGWPGGYEFQLELGVTVLTPWSPVANFTGLTQGIYTIRVRDTRGCSVFVDVILANPTPIVFTASPSTTLVSCFGDKNASITASLPTGGQGSNYSYTLNTTLLVSATASGPQASLVFSGLGAGTYTITVTDGYSCSATSAPIVIAQPTKVSTSLVVATTQSCLTQTRLTLSATGGTGTYTYSADAAFTTVLGSFTTSTTFPVPVGTYVYYVKDANGCISNVSNQIKIDPLPVLTLNLDKTNSVINCAGDNTGDIVATAQGGLGNYSYTLLNGSGTIVQGPTASGNFTGLFAGNYQVKVDSGDCTTLSSMINITQPQFPLIAPYVATDATCNGVNNGKITINASGGTGIIKYAISPNLNQFLDTNIFDKLAPGNYDVIVQDVLGCYVKINFDITEPAPIVTSTIPGTILPEICFGDKDGAFMIEIAGGVLPYSVSLDNPNGTYTTGTPTQSQFDFTRLTGGTHTVYIRDANACDDEWVVVLPESVKINPIAAVDYSCVNNAANNKVTVTVDASITNPADLDYSLDGAPYQTSNIFTSIVPGSNHYIDVRHTNGCIRRTANFEILKVDPLALVLNDGGLNEIVATATGGGGGYQYTFNGESDGTKNMFIIYKSGNYTVEVTDANGCVASATRHFEYIDVCVPNYFTPNGDGISDGWAPGCTINYKDLTFDIFDRYGRKIASYRLGEHWDGKFKGQELPSGDYWYVLRLNDSKDNREFVGHFTLYR